jgi:hypothetical protein
MRWKSWVGPSAGDIRAVKYFAIWPTKLGNEYTVWLESYWSQEEWIDMSRTDPHGLAGYWKVIRTWTENNS